MRTTLSWTVRRFTALLLAALMLLATLPAFGAEDATIYGCVTADQVKFRQYASTSAGYWERLPQGWVMTILGNTTVSGKLWYHVRGSVPSAPNSTYTGYILGDCFRPLTLDETAAWLYNPTQGTIPGTPLENTEPAETPAPVIRSAGGWIMTAVSGVNLRTAPQADADEILTLPMGAMLQISGYTTGWYLATYEGRTGYISEAYVRAPSAVELTDYINGEESDSIPAQALANTAAGYQATIYTTKGDTVTLRSMPATNAVPLAYLPNGTSVTVTGTEGDWAIVLFELTAGYIPADSLIGFAGETGTAAAAENAVFDTGVMATVSVGAGTLPLLKEASESAASLKSIPNGAALYILEAGTVWSKTIYAGQTGYVDSTLITFASDADSYAPYVLITSLKSVNVRQTARKNAKVVDHALPGAVLPLWGSPWTNDGYTWYPVTVNKVNAYVRGDTCRLMTNSDYNSGAIPTPTPTPQAPQTGTLESLSRNLNIRAAATTSSKSLGKLTLKKRIQFTGTTTVNGELWYKVSYKNGTGFVMGKFVKVVSADVTPTAAPTATPAVLPDNLTDVAYTLTKNIYLRKENTMQSGSLTKIVNSGTYLTWTGETRADKNGEKYTWYRIQYLSLTGWIRGDLIHVMTNAEWEAAFNPPQPTAAPVITPTPAPTATPKPDTAQLTDIAYTVTANVFIRKQNTMSSTSVTKVYSAHSYLNLLGAIKDDKNGEAYTWYQVRYNNQTGWIRSDLIHILTNAEYEEEFGGDIIPVEPTPSPTPVPINPDDDEDLGDYVAYDILRYGATGAAVTRLQQALYEQGYLTASNVTGVYNDATRKAIRTFQADNSLTVDGVAGQLTQSALFRTIAYDTSLYPVEKITWAEANKVWPRGSVAMLTDVSTGLSFAAKRYAGGSHADVEPLTAGDTAIMCRIYGVSESQEISEKNLYQRRPLWVTISGRSLAASMYGVPHNPGGDTLPDNDYTGQFCVHFVGSKVHRTNEVDGTHQAAINYAYNNAPVKK